MKHERIQSLDDYFLSLPDTRPKMLWPVYQDVGTMRPLRWFSDYFEAVDFVSANLGRVNLYVGNPKRKAA